MMTITTSSLRKTYDIEDRPILLFIQKNNITFALSLTSPFNTMLTSFCMRWCILYWMTLIALERQFQQESKRNTHRKKYIYSTKGCLTKKWNYSLYQGILTHEKQMGFVFMLCIEENSSLSHFWSRGTIELAAGYRCSTVTINLPISRDWLNLQCVSPIYATWGVAYGERHLSESGLKQKQENNKVAESFCYWC